MACSDAAQAPLLSTSPADATGEPVTGAAEAVRTSAPQGANASGRRRLRRPSTDQAHWPRQRRRQCIPTSRTPQIPKRRLQTKPEPARMTAEAAQRGTRPRDNTAGGRSSLRNTRHHQRGAVTSPESEPPLESRFHCHLAEGPPNIGAEVPGKLPEVPPTRHNSTRQERGQVPSG